MSHPGARRRRSPRAAARPGWMLAVLLAVAVLGCESRPVGSAAAVPGGRPTSQGEAMPASQDVASYTLAARWEPTTNQIHGSGTITYRNPSNDTLGELWLKL